MRSDLRQGSSYEDDVGEGPLAGIHKTDKKGVFQEWTPRPPRFREREYRRVGVGVPDADGTSWEQCDNQPNSRGFGNPQAHPTQYSSILRLLRALCSVVLSRSRLRCRPQIKTTT